MKSEDYTRSLSTVKDVLLIQNIDNVYLSSTIMLATPLYSNPRFCEERSLVMGSSLWKFVVRDDRRVGRGGLGVVASSADRGRLCSRCRSDRGRLCRLGRILEIRGRGEVSLDEHRRRREERQQTSVTAGVPGHGSTARQVTR